MLFIMVGVLILLANLNVLSGHFWLDFFYFIPFLLIAIGIEKIFAGTKFRMVSYATTILLVAAGFWVAFEGCNRNGAVSSFFEAETIREEADPSVVATTAVLRLGTGSITIRDATDDLIYGSFGEWTFKPRFEHKVVDGQAIIELVRPLESRRSWGGVVRIENDEADEWYLSFSRNLPLSLECYGEESDLHLNLSTTPLKDLTVEAPDSDIYLKLGTLEPLVSVAVKGADTKLRLRVPREAGLKVSGVDDPEYLETVGLVRDGDNFVTPGFDTSTPQLRVELDDRFRSLSIDTY